MSIKKVRINSPCDKAPNGRHDWRNGVNPDNKKIYSWCHWCGNMPKGQ